ncbi:hypothetical protein ES708_17310 [subsurface metagenome]
MPPIFQKIKTPLIPEHGLILSPEFIEQSVVSSDFIRAFCHLVGKADDRGILLRATSDGSLHVVSAGVPFEEYFVASGTCLTENYVAPHILESDDACSVIDFLIELFPGIISFRNRQGVWLQDKTLPVGMHSINFIHYGVRIKSTAAGNVKYEVTCYR